MFDIPLAVLLLDQVPHLVASLGVAVSLLQLTDLLRDLLGGVGYESLTVNIRRRQLPLRIPSMLFHLLVQLFLVMLFLVHVVVGPNHGIVIVVSPVLFFREALDLPLFLLLLFFIVLFVIASDDVELSEVVVEVLPFRFVGNPQFLTAEVEIRQRLVTNDVEVIAEGFGQMVLLLRSWDWASRVQVYYVVRFLILLGVFLI